ncbi:hypothetical protein ACFL0Z_02945 [Patescibacteria group bacterium]
MENMNFVTKSRFFGVFASLIVITGLFFALAFVNVPQVQAADVTGFFFTENAYSGNANVSDRLVNNVGYIRLHGSIYSPEGVPVVTAKIWHTAGICLPGVIGNCQPGNLQIAEFNVPVTPDSRPDYYTFTNVPITGMIKPFTDGSWVGQIEVVSEESEETFTSDYSWFWIETREPHLPKHMSPPNAGLVEEGAAAFDWTDVMDYVPPSGLLSGLQGYYFELYTDSNLTNRIFNSGLTNVSNTTTSGLMSGIYYWRVRVVDNVGNFTDWTLPWHFTIHKPGEEPPVEPPPPPNDNPEDPRDTEDDEEEDTTDVPDTVSTTTTPPSTPPYSIPTPEIISETGGDFSTSAARVLGAFTEKTEAAEEEIVEDEGEVKGVAEAVGEDEVCEDTNFAWWLPLVIGFAIALLLAIFARPGKRGWLVVPFVIAILVQLGHWFWWACNCATGPLCLWFWLFNVILLVIALVVYGRKTRPKENLEE